VVSSGLSCRGATAVPENAQSSREWNASAALRCSLTSNRHRDVWMVAFHWRHASSQRANCALRHPMPSKTFGAGTKSIQSKLETEAEVYACDASIADYHLGRWTRRLLAQFPLAKQLCW